MQKESRAARLFGYLPESADAVIITNEKNQKYLSGFDFTDGFVIVTRSGCFVLTDFRYIEAAKESVFDGV